MAAMVSLNEGVRNAKLRARRKGATAPTEVFPCSQGWHCIQEERNQCKYRSPSSSLIPRMGRLPNTCRVLQRHGRAATPDVHFFRRGRDVGQGQATIANFPDCSTCRMCAAKPPKNRAAEAAQDTISSNRVVIGGPPMSTAKPSSKECRGRWWFEKARKMG